MASPAVPLGSAAGAGHRHPARWVVTPLVAWNSADPCRHVRVVDRPERTILGLTHVPIATATHVVAGAKAQVPHIGPRVAMTREHVAGGGGDAAGSCIHIRIPRELEIRRRVAMRDRMVSGSGWRVSHVHDKSV